MEFTADRNIKKGVEYSRHRKFSVEYSEMIRILVAFKTMMSCLVLHLVPTQHYTDNIRITVIIILEWIEDRFARMVIREFYTPLETLK